MATTSETDIILGIEARDRRPRAIDMSYIAEVDPTMFSVKSFGAHTLRVGHFGRKDHLTFDYDGIRGGRGLAGGGPLTGKQHRLDIKIFEASANDLDFTTEIDGMELQVEEGRFRQPDLEGGREFESLLLLPFYDVPHQTGRLAVFMTQEPRLSRAY